MIAYFDTSSIVPLLAEEPGSKLCWDALAASSVAVTTTIAYVEATAAIARAWSSGRLGALPEPDVVKKLDGVFRYFNVTDVDGELVRSAARLAWKHPLRGYDAVHCAAALLFAEDDLVAFSGDRQLLAVWRSLGLATVDTSAA